MTGEHLYGMYVDALKKEYSATQCWDDLDEGERRAWSAMAARLEVRDFLTSMSEGRTD